jgi:hypothetical protein
MEDLVQKRRIFAKILDKNLRAYARGEPDEIEFPVDLAYEDDELGDWITISDPNLRSAWIIADEFFDAIVHDFDKLSSGQSIQKGLEDLNYITHRFMQGKDIDRENLNTHPS